ncbi:solute:Na+ symporter, SSS family [Aquiflexum balticum DSM 16537]|uniref:Solute:Na+ symporter, SSS family n=1 Tax=Aquiflexum balticum DSM 16537 TaxID=758820 RepID=A0A1W2GYX5_9BACT|nr:sodium:solute symporter [Aquiflexum balticum]SMD41754.1 solute:Na+ symporter, SSS family [Aquiflexum balticum DSM 16537]
MNLSLIDLIVFLAYVVGIISFGASFYFKKRVSIDYITGGGRLPAWALGMSIFATYVSSISFLALPGIAYQSNWNGFVFSLSIPFAAFIAVRYFVPLYRKLQSPSAYAYLENRFGLWARVYASTCYLLTQLARMGAIMYLLALPMNALFGWSIPLIIVATGLGVVIYAMLGGIEAVVWTDVVQGILLILGALTCFILIVWEMPGGCLQIYEIAQEQNKLSLGSFSLDWSQNTFWVILVYGLFINLQNFGVDQSYIQRYLGAKTASEAKKLTWLGSLLYVPVSLLFFMIGTALFAFYQQFPENLPLELQTIENADKVFPYFIVSTLPKGLTGLMIAAIFAAGMSTISTSINSSATVILEDHVKKYLFPNLPKASDFKVLYVSSFMMGIGSILIGLAFNGVSSALDAWWALASIFSGGILGLFLLGVLTQSKSNIPAIIGVILGLLLIAWISLEELFITYGLPVLELHKNLAIVLGTMTVFFVGFVLGWMVNRMKSF